MIPIINFYYNKKASFKTIFISFFSGQFVLRKLWKTVPFTIIWLLKVLSMLFIFGAAMLSSVLLKHEAQLNDNKDPWTGSSRTKNLKPELASRSGFLILG